MLDLMPTKVDEIYQQLVRLSPIERRQILAKLADDLRVRSQTTKARRRWREIRGIVAYPMCGEDAQHWVSNARDEAGKHRAAQWRGTPSGSKRS